MGMTFFEWVARDGQVAVVRALGEGFHPVRVHRAAHAKHGVDEGLIARCEAVLGAEFDRAGTLDRWYQLRHERAAASGQATPDATPTAPTESDSAAA